MPGSGLNAAQDAANVRVDGEEAILHTTDESVFYHPQTCCRNPGCRDSSVAFMSGFQVQMMIADAQRCGGAARPEVPQLAEFSATWRDEKEGRRDA